MRTRMVVEMFVGAGLSYLLFPDANMRFQFMVGWLLVMTLYRVDTLLIRQNGSDDDI